MKKIPKSLADYFFKKDLLKACAIAMGFEFRSYAGQIRINDSIESRGKKKSVEFNPIENDIQAFNLVKTMGISIHHHHPRGGTRKEWEARISGSKSAKNENLNIAICECVYNKIKLRKSFNSHSHET